MEYITTKELVAAVVLALIGSGGIVGLCFYFIRRYLEGKLKAREAEDRRRKDLAGRRRQVTDQLEHAYGRIFFWMYRGLKALDKNGEINGDLEKAFAALEQAELQKKKIDQEVISEYEQD